MSLRKKSPTLKMSDLLSLPRDLLILTLSQLDLASLARICTSSSQLNSFCHSREFWVFKYSSDFNEPFPPSTNVPARTVYIRKKEAILLSYLREVKLSLNNEISYILVSAATESDKNKMRQFVDTKFIPFLSDKLAEYEIEDLDDRLVENLAVDLHILLVENDIRFVPRRGRPPRVAPTGPSDLAEKIVQATRDNWIQVKLINSELNSLFEALSIFKIPHRYMTRLEQAGLRYFSRNIPDQWVRLPPVPIDEGQTPPMPLNLPPPPPRAALLSMTTEPRPLPDEFPLPYPPAPPGTAFPPELSTISIPPPIPPFRPRLITRLPPLGAPMTRRSGE